ncbi:MAG: hypothetical protein IPJ06_19575 [Saprospiraceae bacterium]|nr:hypothetical protein [Saprospiraceae bacterium]
MMIRLFATTLFLVYWSLQVSVSLLSGPSRKMLPSSSDLTEGRMTGSRGERLSAQFIAERYEQIGLTPKGTEGFYQTFSFKAPANPRMRKVRVRGKDLHQCRRVYRQWCPPPVIIGAH